MIEQTKTGIRIHLYVQPNGKKSEFLGEYNGMLKIRIKAPPVDGKANEEVERFIAEFFNTPKKNVTLIRGQTSREKVVEVVNIDLAVAKKILNQKP